MGKNKTPAMKPKPSYRDLDPLEQGGPAARRGFAYQDHVAAGKCLDMLLDGGPCEVWCEAEDDIVLVWLIQGEEWFEFVQVKSNELDQLWSVAKLCEQESAKDGKRPGACIVEKSLAHDRGDGKCRFRFVTCREPHSELAVLKLALDDPARTSADSGLAEVVAAVGHRIPRCTSPSGNGVEFCVRMTVWEYKASVTDIEHENLIKIDHILHRENAFLAPDQKRELYAKLLQKVYEASMACGRTQKDRKRIKAADLRVWLLQQVAEMARPASAGHRDELSAEIDRLRAKVESLRGDVDAEAGKIPFERLSDEISDGINEYLNLLNEGDTSRWPHGAIRFDLGESSFRIRVGQKPWSSLGATSIGYVLLGYHYALLKLSGRDGYNYPGLALIDFPMTLADKTTIADKENYLIEPFVRLFRSRPAFQLIVCGRAFENLKDVHRITLTTVWKQEEADGSTAPENPTSEA
jgi:Cap4 dsDNA endonuclease